MGIECDGLCGQGRVSAKLGLAKGVTDDYSCRAATFVIVSISEGAAQSGTHSQHVERAAADVNCFRVTGFSAVGQIQTPFSPGKYSRKRLLVGSKSFPDWIRHLTVPIHGASPVFSVRDGDFSQLLRIPDRQRTNTDRIE